METDRAKRNAQNIEMINWDFWKNNAPKYSHYCVSKLGEPPLYSSRDQVMFRTNYGEFLRMPFPAKGVIYWAFEDGRGLKRFTLDFKCKVIKWDQEP